MLNNLYGVYIGGTIMYEIIANLLKKSKKTIIITGNGINIDLQNIENKRNIDNQTYDESLTKDDNKFINYYRDILKQISVNKPNKAHDIIEKWKDKNIIDLIITQNIDGYHGIKNVIELHGNIENFYCIDCKKKFDSKYYQKSHKCNNVNDDINTKCDGILRPNIVLNGEPPKHLELALFNIYKSDIVLIVGNEMDSSPVNKLSIIAKESGAKLIAINREPIESISSYIDYFIYEEDIINSLEKIDNLISS